jgi:8-oxo-dGTP diphosphatase
MKTYFVVTGILTYQDKILILKKSPDDRNYPNRWSFCSGFVKEFEAGEDTVLREIKEETGLDARITKTGDVIKVEDKEKNINWLVLTFLCETKKNGVKLDPENVDFKWITKYEIKDYDFVPGLIDDLKAIDFL